VQAQGPRAQPAAAVLVAANNDDCSTHDTASLQLILLLCRRKPSSAPAGWWGSPQEPSLLASLGEFTESMGSTMAALGMFAQVRCSC
jgi:hypothetical protein